MPQRLDLRDHISPMSYLKDSIARHVRRTTTHTLQSVTEYGMLRFRMEQTMVPA